MDTKSDQPSPKATEGGPAKAEAQRPADHKVGSEKKGERTPKPIPENKQEPPDEVNGRSNQSGEEEESGEARSLWVHFKEDPLPWILSISTAGILIASIGLVAATIGVYRATDRLVDATIGLKTATDSLVKYAGEQASDMKNSIQAAKDAAQSSKDMAEIAREALGRQKADIGVSSAELRSLENYSNVPIEARVKIKNTGQTRADNVRIVARVAVTQNPRARPCTVDMRNTSPNTIGPGADYTASAYLKITQEERRAILDGKAVIYTYGRITYTDIQKEDRFRNFRLAYRGSGNESSEGPLTMSHTSDGCNDGN